MIRHDFYELTTIIIEQWEKKTVEKPKSSTGEKETP